MKRNLQMGFLGAALPLCLTLTLESVSRPATAAPDAGNDSGNGLEEITVTARKRSEKLLDTPVAVVAFSAQNIEQQAIYSLADLAQATPGYTQDSTVGGSARNDRSFPTNIIRGMIPSTTYSPTTTVFIDGAPIISGNVEGLDDLERVEVLEGPQSAYFGRETFAGAINLVTKDPSDVFGGHASVLAGDPNYYDARLAVEGPIIGDFLTARATYRYYTKSGSYRNSATADVASPGRLGDQSTQSESLELVARPVENFKIKALFMQWADRDGPSAQSIITQSQANCLGGQWFCGTAPHPPAPAANTLVDGATQGFLNAANSAGSGALAPSPNGYGLKRDAYHWSLGADYDIPSLFTISSLSSADHQLFSSLQDVDNADTSGTPDPVFGVPGVYDQGYYNYPFLVQAKYRNFSQELRLTSDANKRFRWLVGLNYEWSRVDQFIGGSTGSYYYLTSLGATSTNNTGGFYGLAFDVTNKLTVNFEGRFERDEQSATATATSVAAKASYNNFTPRFIVQYKFTPDIMGYATFSEGVNPGAFNNGSFALLTAADQASLQATYGATIEVKPEKLKNYELGVKGRFLDNTLELSADIYHDLWSNQINTASLVYLEGGLPKLVTVELNNERTNLDGLEAKLNWAPFRQLSVDAAFAVNNTDIKQGPCVQCAGVTGTSDVNGNQLPYVSKYQGSAGVQYGDAVVFMPDWNYFARVDDRYKSGSYASADNLVRTPNLNFVNARVGLTRETLRLEAFVDNAFNESGITNLAATYNIANPFETYAKNDALLAGLPQLRTFGIRVSYKFGGVK